MKRSKPLLVGLAAVPLAAAAIVVTALPALAANILTNGGFESGTLSGWSCSGTTGSVVSTPVHSGTRALAGAATASDNAQCVQTVSVQPNTSYTLTAWVRGNYVYLGVTGGASNWTPAATNYTQLTVMFTTAAGQTSAQVYLHGWYAQGTYYADDVSLDGPGGPQPTTTTVRPTTPPPTTAPPTTTPPTTTPPPPDSATPPTRAGPTQACADWIPAREFRQRFRLSPHG